MTEATSVIDDGVVPPSSTPCVFRTACGRSYFAQVRVGGGRRKYLGTFKSEADAGAAVDAWKKAHPR